jgi:thiamine-phosphate pyrophosphorylase
MTKPKYCSMGIGKPKLAGLYAITPDTADSDWLRQRGEAVLRGGASLVQYRSKSENQCLRRQQAVMIQRLCRKYEALFIVNDDVALAESLGADGVHLGRSDTPVAEGSKRLGASAMIGATCHDQAALAIHAMAEGADYVGIGSIFPSSTKPDTVAASLELCARLTLSGIPVAAIGGITANNADQVWQCGASMLAVIGGVFLSENPEAAARRILNACSPSELGRDFRIPA